MKNDVLKRIKDSVAILKLDKAKMSEVSHDASATIWGAIFLIAPSLIDWLVISSTASSFFRGMFSRFFFWPMFVPVITVFATFYLMSMVAERAFGGKKDHFAYVRPILYVGSLLILSVIPFVFQIFDFGNAFELLGLIWKVLIVWMFVVSYFMLKIVHNLSKEDSYIVLAVGVILYFLVGHVVSFIFVGDGYIF